MCLSGYTASMRLYWNDDKTKQKIYAFINNIESFNIEYYEHEYWLESDEDYFKEECSDKDFFNFYYGLQVELEEKKIHYEMNLSVSLDGRFETKKRAYDGFEIRTASYTFNDDEINKRVYRYLLKTFHNKIDAEMAFNVCVNGENWEDYSDEKKEKYISGIRDEEYCSAFMHNAYTRCKKRCDTIISTYYDNAVKCIEIFEFEDFARLF